MTVSVERAGPGVAAGETPSGSILREDRVTGKRMGRLELRPSVSITRRVSFAAAHALYRDDWDEARNREVYGSCVNDHGHNYQLEVTIVAAEVAASGMLVNLRVLDRVIRAAVVDRVDHRHLNRDVDFLRGVVPTVENLAIAFAAELNRSLDGLTLQRVRLVESENNSADVVFPWL